MGVPGFFGLYNSQRALMAAQMALNTVNHNISNANTEGYSRQRVEVSADDPYTHSGAASNKVVQFGQGVVVDGLTRSRDVFLDTQYRLEAAIGGKAEEQSEILRQVEAILGEPSDTGLSTSMAKMFESIQDLVTDPQSITARTSFFQQANEFVDTIQQQGRQLLNLHSNLVGVEGDATSFPASQLGLAVRDANSKMEQLAGLNKQILSITSSGGAPNDLLDKRDVLLDELAELGDFTITTLPGEQIEISLGNSVLVRGVRQLDTLELYANTGANATEVPSLIRTATGGTDVTANVTEGTIRGILDAAGDSSTDSTVYGTFTQLNTLMDTMATAFNAVQQAGRDLSGNRYTTGANSTVFQVAASYPGTGPQLLHYELNPNLTANPDRLALAADDATYAGNFGGVGDNRNALAFAGIRDNTYAVFNNQDVEDFHQSLVAQLGIDVNAAQGLDRSQTALLDSLDARRQEESGVNLDEESIDLLRFQRAFEAGSRVVRAMDEMYQSILNMV